jgi:hypothetical protein
MRNIGVRIGIIALIVVGAFVLRPFLTGNAGDLNVGDCFDVPATDQETVEDVQHHPCDQDHGGEVVFVGDYPGSGSDPYPTDDEMFAFLTDKCVPAFSAYTGTDFTSQTTYDIGWFQPTEEGWKDDDQGVSCYAYRLDETNFKGSIKAG